MANKSMGAGHAAKRETFGDWVQQMKSAHSDEQKLGLWGPLQAIVDWFKTLFGGIEDKAQQVFTDLKPVIGDFVNQCAGIIEQVGEKAFTDMLAAADTIAQDIETAMASATGAEKFSEFLTRLGDWAKAEAPTILTLLEAGIGPVIRVILEMIIASAKTTVSAARKA